MKARKMLLVVAGTSAALWVGLPGTAWANHCPPGATYPADCVHGGQQDRDGNDGGGGAGNVVAPFADVRGAQVTRGGAGSGGSGGSGGGLPVTGGDVVGLTIMGIGALGIGTLLVRSTQRIA